MRYFTIALALFWVGLAATPTLAQNHGERIEASARKLAESRELPRNQQLRFLILADQRDRLLGGDEAERYLHFFEQTRVLFWNRPESQHHQAAMSALEQAVAAVAKERGQRLNLSRVGYSVEQAVPEGPLLSTQGLDAGALARDMERAERALGEVLGALSTPGAEAAFAALQQQTASVRDQLGSRSGVRSDDVRALWAARAQAALLNRGRLPAEVDRMMEGLRSLFPPSDLRRTRGGTLRP